MDQRQRELRHAAAQAFMESLDQLQGTLQATDPRPLKSELGSGSSPANSPTRFREAPSARLDPVAFEQAAADIEQFIQSHPAESTEFRA